MTARSRAGVLQRGATGLAVALTFGSLIAAALVTASSQAAAQDATWLASPGSGDFNTGANWSTATVPTGTASFGTSGTTSLSFSQDTTVGGWTFNAGASNYTFTNGNTLSFTGAGIAVNGGSAAITNTTFLNFNNSSTAGNAAITNTGGFVNFYDTSTAGNAAITNNTFLIFNNSSTAGNAAITNNTALFFHGNSTAGNAAITNKTFLYFYDNSTAGNAAITNGFTVDFSKSTGPLGNNKLSAGSIAGTGSIYLGLNELTVGSNNLSTTVSGAISACGFSGQQCLNAPLSVNGGSLVKIGTGTLTLSGVNTYGSGTTISGGTLQLSGAGTLGAPTGTTTVNSGGTLDLGGTTQTQAALTLNGGTLKNGHLNAPITSTGGTINGLGGSASLTTTSGTTTFLGVNTYTGATTINGGMLQAGAANVFAPTSRVTLNAGGTLDLGGFAQTINNVSLAGGTLQNGSLTGAVSSSGGTINGLGGSASLTTTSGTTTVLGLNTYTGATTINGGTLQAGAANVFVPASKITLNAGGTFDLGGFAQAINNVSLAGGTLQNGSLTGAVRSTGGTINGLGGASLTTTSGTTILTGTNTFASTTVNGGILNVIGTLSDPTINSGGTLTGTGSVGATQVNAGGSFAPGNGTPGSSMTVTGNLALQSGAMYVVALNPSTASFANVTGTATLGGAGVNAVFAGGSYVSKQYKILTAAGGVSGTFASTVVNTNLPANFHTTLSYDANDAYLNLILNFAIPGGLNSNQQAVGNALTNYFNTTGSIPLIYSALTANGLTQASGEGATGAQQTTFQAMSQFMGVMTDPFAGRGDGINGSNSATGYAEEGEASAYTARKATDAFAMFTKAPLAKVYEPRWSVWASGFGGSQSTSGNAAFGSNDTTSRIAGTAVGADYLFSPNTLAGFALAGGGTSFGVNNLGSGRSDLFQAGAYVRHSNGPAYITGALAYGWQDITTNRTVSIAGIDQLRAEFNANAYSGRVEGGYRFIAPAMGGVGITPYAAGQFTTFNLPAYAESVLSGTSNFALNYAARSVTDARSELGIRTDKSFAMSDDVLTLRGRVAWAHDYDPNRAAAATFQALPGASFVVGGAAQASDSVLTTASAEMKWTNGWSATATFEGEFSNVTRSYAGKGVVRYAW